MTRIESSCGHESLSILLRYACNRLSVLALTAAMFSFLVKKKTSLRFTGKPQATKVAD